MEESGYKIGYLGPRGTFSEDALLYYLDGREIQTTQYSDNDAVLAAFARGDVSEAIIAFRNTLSGPVFNNLYWLVEHPTVRIKALITLKIRQNLITINGTPRIKVVFSHSAAFGQCTESLGKLRSTGRLSRNTRLIPVGSTALAVKDLEQLIVGVKDPDDEAAIKKYYEECQKEGVTPEKREPRPLDKRFAAAIASQRAAGIYEKTVLFPGIQDHENNFTSFWVLADKDESKPTGNDRTVIVFLGVKTFNEFYSQVVAKLLECGLEITWTEFKTARKSLHSYYYMVEVAAHRADPRMEEAWRVINEVNPRIKKRIMGSFPDLGIYESA